MFGKTLKGTLGVGVGCLVLLIGLAIVGAIVGGSGRTTTTPTTPPLSGVAATSTIPPAPAAKTWTVVKAWTGEGIKDTESFTVGAEWRIDWDFSPGQYGGIIQVYVHDAATKRLTGVAANTQKQGADTSFQRGAGTYYLSINSANGGWKVAVQDSR